MRLLDYLANRCGLYCLSDLRHSPQLKSQIEITDPANFPLRDWADAVVYLCGKKISFDSARDAKAYLLK